MRLPQSELWLIDWVICGQGEAAIGGDKLGALMGWAELRERVWRAQIGAELSTTDPTHPAEAEIELSQAECEQLLAILPTTFRWGTGEDVGFGLKRRVAQELWGAEMMERHQMDATLAAIFNKEESNAGSTRNRSDTYPGQDAAPNAA
jgi:hypothetical protein